MQAERIGYGVHVGMQLTLSDGTISIDKYNV